MSRVLADAIQPRMLRLVEAQKPPNVHAPCARLDKGGREVVGYDAVTDVLRQPPAPPERTCQDQLVTTFERVDTSFFETAPVLVRASAVIAAPRERVFTAIASDPAGWGRWFPGLDGSGHWTTIGTPGVGSVRVMRMFGVRFEECVLAWETDKRWAFRVEAAGAPLGKALAEDYLLSDEGAGTRLAWTVALRPALGLKPPARLLRPAVQRLLDVAGTRLAKVA